MCHQENIRNIFEKVANGEISAANAFNKMQQEHLSSLLYPRFCEDNKLQPIAIGEGILEGDVTGHLILDKTTAAALNSQRSSADNLSSYIYSIPEGDIEDFESIKKAAAFVTSHPGKTTFSPVQSVLDGIPTIIGASIEYHSSDDPATLHLKTSTDKTVIVETRKRWITAMDGNGNRVDIPEGSMISASGQSGNIFLGILQTSPSRIEEIYCTLSNAYQEAELAFGPAHAWRNLTKTEVFQRNKENIINTIKSSTWKGFRILMEYALAKTPVSVLVNVHNTSCVVKSRLLAANIQENNGDLNIIAYPHHYGVGLMRDERMWTAPQEIDVLRILLLGPDCAPPDQYEAAVTAYKAFHGDKYFSAFCADPGGTCIIRTLCMPFSKFLPDNFDVTAFSHRNKLDAARVRKAYTRLVGERETYHGYRGIRLFSTRQDLARLWITTVLNALHRAKISGFKPRVRFLLATLTIPEEAELFIDLLEEVASEVFGASSEWPIDGVSIMLETSGAFICLEDILKVKGNRITVNGGLIGTNDFTTACLNMNRNDAPRHLIPSYVERGLFAASPFKHVYVPIVGRAMHDALQRSTALGLLSGHDYFWGLAGELTTDWYSVQWLASHLSPAGLNYMSTSPETIISVIFAATASTHKEHKETAFSIAV